MRTIVQHLVAVSIAISASATVAAPNTEPGAPSTAAAKIQLKIAPEIERRWPELRVKIATSGVAEIADVADLLVTTDDELGDYVELRPIEASRPSDLRPSLIRLGRLSSGDAQAALTPVLILLQRQKAVLDLSDGNPPDRVEACKVDPREPTTCLPIAMVRAAGPMLGTSLRNTSREPRFVALLETSSGLEIGAAALRERQTTVRLEPGERLLVEPGAGTGRNGINHQIVVISKQAFDPSALVQPSPYGSTATCYVRLYADCIARVVPLPDTAGLSAIRFTYDAQDSGLGPAMGGGEAAARGDADWMVELYSTLPYTPEEIEADKSLPVAERKYLAERTPEERAHTCGGTIIAANLVLTAAHCVATGRFLKPNEARMFSDRRVRIGSLRLGRGGETRAIVGAVIHDGYNGKGSGQPNDIALLLVKGDEPVRLAARPLKVADTAPAPGTTVTGLGWGYTQSVAPGANLILSMSNEVQRNPQRLQQAPLEILAAPTCIQRVQDKWRPGMLCLVTPKAVTASGGAPTFSCRGDSGGPLVRYYGSDQEELVGLTSWSRGCGYKDTPSVYTDASYFAQWVKAARKAIQPGAVVRVGDRAGGAGR